MDTKNFDNWAKTYDIVFGKYRADIDFYLKEAKKVRGKVLEVGCGTGRVYLELLKNGVDVYGIDISGEMLRVLKKKAREMGIKPKVKNCLLYTSPSPRDISGSRMPSSA